MNNRRQQRKEKLNFSLHLTQRAFYQKKGKNLLSLVQLIFKIN